VGAGLGLKTTAGVKIGTGIEAGAGSEAGPGSDWSQKILPARISRIKAW